MVNYAFVGGLLVAYLVIAIAVTMPDPPALALTIGAAVVAVVPALVFFPFAKTLWAAIDLVLHGFEAPGDR